jgi:hypothetical protein
VVTLVGLEVSEIGRRGLRVIEAGEACAPAASAVADLAVVGLAVGALAVVGSDVKVH